MIRCTPALARRLAVVVALVTALAAPSVGVAHAEPDCGAPDNPWGFDFAPCATEVIGDAPSEFCDYFDCIPSFWESTRGYLVQCRDWMFSHSGGRRGACSRHQGEWRVLRASPG